MMVIQIRGKNSRELWLDGKPVKTEPLYEGGIVFHDLRQNPRFHFYDPLDSVNYFLLRKTLDAIADDENASRISGLKFTPGVGIKDEVVERLTRLLLPAFDSPKRVSRLFADYVSLALGSHVAQTYGGMRITVAPGEAVSPHGKNVARKSCLAPISEEISQRPTLRENAHYQRVILPARFGVRPVCHRTNGSCGAGLTWRMICCATPGFRLLISRALAASPIKATSRKSIRVCVTSARAHGGDSTEFFPGREGCAPLASNSSSPSISIQTDKRCSLFTIPRAPRSLTSQLRRAI